MITLITFDLDDTLWDVRPALIKAEQAQNDWLQRHYPKSIAGIDSAAMNERKRQLIKRHPDLIHHISRFRQRFLYELLLEAGLATQEAEVAAQAAFDAFIARRNDVALFDQTVPMLQQLQPHFRLGALTNGNADVSKTPLAPYFEFALKAEDVGAAKPEPQLFDAALTRTQTLAQHAIHVGDSHDHDIVGAHRAGMRSVWLNTSGDCSDLADASIRCLSELPRVVQALAAQ
jgi:HAD superfamily hydrolase (TIGR01549 family)